jgi:hypothetical protein
LGIAGEIWIFMFTRGWLILLGAGVILVVAALLGIGRLTEVMRIIGRGVLLSCSLMAGLFLAAQYI